MYAGGRRGGYRASSGALSRFAGIGKMDYVRFLAFSLCGGLFWISFFVYGGYYFGNLPVVKENLTAFIIAIIFVSILPGVIEYLRSRRL